MMTCVTILTGCKQDAPASVDSAVTAAPPPPIEAEPAVNTGWNEDVAGPVMLVSMPDNQSGAFVILPALTDSMLAAAPYARTDSVTVVEMELMGRAGLAGTVNVNLSRLSESRQECPAWPSAELSDTLQRPWRVGLAKGVAVPLRLDSLEIMGHTDSAAVTRELARLSSIAAEGDDPAFQGLPFTVRRAYRFAIPGTVIIAGEVIRRINEEANPREEHLLLIAERSSGVSGEYSAAFHTRVAGKEDAVRTSEILAVLRFVKNDRAAIVVSFDYGDGGRTALVEREGNRRWRITWRSAYTGC
jgi:hypothetical protein